ncbi:hypothetical protein GCM10022224_088950 [Nonomuraea antimicrobica]|uniref:Uncharacterized protein n=1 Tax=Nonomuraea antimicrobica TaxID=561173 RepID=A0ABP7DVE8_9ACTN
MRITGKIAVVASALAAAGVATTPAATAQATSAQAAPAWVAYYGLTAAKSAERVRQLEEQGYRPITVNVSDGEKYAAVWIKDGSSTEWGIWQGMTAEEYRQRFDAGLRSGAQPVSVSATGPADSAVFTVIFEKKKGDFLAKSNLTPARFAAVNKEAAAKGLALSSVDAFGTAGDVRYAAVWSANTGGAWNYTYGKSRQQHEAEVYAKKEEGYRPVRASVAPDGTYAAVWRKDGVKSWAHYVDMSASGYQKRFDDLKGKGLHPVQVNAENGKYVAIWE